MISIAIDDSACLAVGTKGTHALSADVIWTGHGWIIADMCDASAMLEANRWAPFGKVVGLREAMEADDVFSLHYLAALFKRAADALRALGEPSTDDLAVAMPSAAVRWMRSAMPADEGSSFYFQPDHEDVLKDFQRAAQIAGFKRASVSPTALCLFEHFPERKAFERKLQNRAAVVEVFRTGFSLVPVGAESKDAAWSCHGRQLWIDHDVEAWAVGKAQQAVGEHDGLSHKIRAAIAGNQPIRINGAQNGKAELHELAPSVLAADTDYVPDLAGIPDPASLAQLLLHPVHDQHFNPRYLAILVSGWLSDVPLVKEILERYLQESLRGAETATPPPVWGGGALRGAAEGARKLAEREGSWVTSGSAEALDLTRGPLPPEKLADAKATGEKHVRIDGAKRPAIGRLSWLVDAADRVAVATLQGGGAKRHYRIEYQLQPWESRARVEAEVTIEQDDRVLLTTLVDGLPAPALVVPLTEKGLKPEPINAIAPGRFQLYLNDEHRLVTQASLDFERGPRGTVACFAPALETR